MKKYVKEGFSCNCFASLKKYVRAQSIKIRNQQKLHKMLFIIYDDIESLI